MPSSEKETKENRKKKEKKKDCLFSLAEAGCQGFAGENYARRASFSRGKRRSRLTLTGRRRQATFAGVFVLSYIELFFTWIVLRRKSRIFVPSLTFNKDKNLIAMKLSTDIAGLLRQNGITRLYHFTDRANIQSIIDNGGLYSWKACDNKGISVKRPGGSATSRSLDQYRGLENYVRLSFTRNHPMMYVAQNDGRISNPVILEIDLSVVNLATTKFSDRNATKNGAVIRGGYEGALNIHFQTVTQPNHFNLTPEEKEFYQAEVLVLEKIPISCITNIDYYRPKPKPTTYPTSYTGSSTYRTTTSSSSGTYNSNTSKTSENDGCLGCLPLLFIILLPIIIGILSSL